MLRIDIPGGPTLQLAHLVLDYNGTMALDGKLLPGVAERLGQLYKHLTIHVLTADTFGLAARELEGLPVRLTVIPPGQQAAAKLAYLESLGPETCVSIGNGRNDQLMLEAAALGIAVIGGEGAALTAITAAMVITKDILAALDLLLHPQRLQATLRT